MKRTSSGETGGGVPLVVGGRVRVGFPGAPGWTTTGFAGTVCWAQTREEDKLARILTAASTHEHAATHITIRISRVHFTERGLTCRKYLSIVIFTLSHLVGVANLGDAMYADFPSLFPFGCPRTNVDRFSLESTDSRKAKISVFSITNRGASRETPVFAGANRSGASSDR